MKNVYEKILGVLFAASLPLAASAQGVQTVKPAPGLMCMSLDDAALQATSQATLPPVLANPAASSQRLGYPSSVVFVHSPLVQQNGYLSMVRLNGQAGWIEASRVRAWRPLNGGNATCTPSIMSNGRLGTSIH